MDKKLYGQWTNKLVSVETCREKMTAFIANCSELEKALLSPDDRKALLMKNKEKLIDVYLILQRLFENDTDAVKARCRALNEAVGATPTD